MMTRTQQLAVKIQAIYMTHKAEIDMLPHYGPRGGCNACGIQGWVNLGNGTITKAALKTDMPVKNWWSGSMPTPSSAVPMCASWDILAAHKQVFG